MSIFDGIVKSSGKFFGAAKKCLISVLVLSTFATSASAGEFLCYGKLGLLGVTETGDVIVKIVNGSETIAEAHYICNVVSQGGYVTTPTACKASLDILIAARNADKVVYIGYSELAPVFSCKTIPAWSKQLSARSPRY